MHADKAHVQTASGVVASMALAMLVAQAFWKLQPLYFSFLSFHAVARPFEMILGSAESICGLLLLEVVWITSTEAAIVSVDPQRRKASHVGVRLNARVVQYTIPEHQNVQPVHS